MKKVCKYCNKIFPKINIKVFANHVRWCTLNTSNGDKGISTMKDVRKSQIHYTFHIKNCLNCNKEFTVQRNNGRAQIKERTCCSRKCSGAYSQKFIMDSNYGKKLLVCRLCGKEVLVDKRRGRNFTCLDCLPKGICNKKSSAHFLYSKGRGCIECNTLIANANTSGYCIKCLRLKKSKNNLKAYYRSLCRFRFSINSFPKEFDIDLIRKFGWYSAKNHGNNHQGVSRDHIISIAYGYANNIPPYYISHPANCRIVLNRDNQKKNMKCGITLPILISRIKKWNKKYAPVTVRSSKP